MLRVSGDFSGLKRIEQKLAKAAQAKRAILKALEEEAINQINEGFDAARDPYGRGWKPTIRGGEILQKDGGLKGSLFRKRGSDSFTVGFSIMYAAVHQYGATIKAKTMRPVTFFGKFSQMRKLLQFNVDGRWALKEQVKIPARPMVPTASRGLPPSWRAAFEKAAHAALRKILG